MNLGEAAIDQRPDEIVHAPDHYDAPDDKRDPRADAVLHDEHHGRRSPDHAAAHDRQDGQRHRDDAPEEGIGDAGKRKRDAQQRALDRGDCPGADHRGYRHIPESLTKFLRVWVGEWDVGSRVEPDIARMLQNVVETKE